MRKFGLAQVIPALEARVHFGEVIRKSHTEHTSFVVEKSGIPVVAIIPAEEYQRWFNEREERFRVIDRIHSKLPRNVSSEEVERDIALAIRSVRSRRHVQSRS